MDRKALSTRLEGLSSVFASETSIATDLKAMAFSIGKMSSEKFNSILASEYLSDLTASDDKEDEINEEVKEEVKEDVKEDVEEDVEAKCASTEGTYWNREASDAVLANLIRDVSGGTLTKEQTPDGSKKAEKPATLKEEQTPNISEDLNSGMVSKSKTPVIKSSSDNTDDEDVEDKAAAEDVIQPIKPEPGDTDENASKPSKSVGSVEDLAEKENKEAYMSEGIELNQPMMDVVLDSREAADLSRLFS